MYGIGQTIKNEWLIESYLIDVDDITGYICKNTKTGEYKIIDDELISKNCIN